MSPRGPKPDDKTDQEMAYLFLRVGLTMQEIGDAYGVTRQRVYERMRRLGIKAGRLNQRRVRMRKLYRFLIEYKLANGGNSPTMVEMTKGAELYIFSAVMRTLRDLEEDGFIRLNVTKRGQKRYYQVIIRGEKWTPPDNWENNLPPEDHVG